MSKATLRATFRPAKMVVPDSLKEECSYVLLQQNIQQSFVNNKDAQGNSLPKGVDLFETGDLKDQTESDADGYQFEASYAEHVENNYHFSGLSDASLSEAAPKLTELFNEAGNTLLEDE